MATGHYPVMLEETIQALALSGGEMVVDARSVVGGTLGGYYGSSAPMRGSSG